MQSLNLLLKSFDSRLLERAVKEILKVISMFSAQAKGPIPLPYKKRKYTVNRSPHIDKKSREQFEITLYKRLIILLNCSPQLMKALVEMNLPAGIDIKLKVRTEDKDGTH